MDRMAEEAFRLNVKWSLQELSRAINGDGKSAPNPLLRVKVVLEGDKVWGVLIVVLRLTEFFWLGIGPDANHFESAFRLSFVN